MEHTQDNRHKSQTHKRYTAQNLTFIKIHHLPHCKIKDESHSKKYKIRKSLHKESDKSKSLWNNTCECGGHSSLNYDSIFKVTLLNVFIKLELNTIGLVPIIT